MLNAVKRIDIRIMTFFANRQHPLLKDVMTGFSSLGSPVNSMVFLSLMFYFDISLFLEAAVALGAAWFAVYGMKFLVSRERPEGSTETGMTSSFPSGHAATAFVFAALISSSFTGLEPLMFSLALLVSSSRLYLQTHYLSDVLGGIFIGILVALAV